MTITERFEMAQVNHPNHPTIRLLQESYGRHKRLNDLQLLTLYRYSRGKERASYPEDDDTT